MANDPASLAGGDTVNRLERHAVYGVFGVLWLSGCAWLLLDQCCATHGEFGPLPHPRQAALLFVHGLTSIPCASLLGWVAARHADGHWRERRRRRSGGIFSAVTLALSISGFALFFLTDDDAQRMTRVLHEITGIGVAAFALEHWRGVRRNYDL